MNTFLLNLDNWAHIGQNIFEKINWPHINDCFKNF